MKNGRKILSIILTICMVMQILPVFATEGTAQAPVGGAGGAGITYLINDDFSAPTAESYTAGTDGWELIADNGFDKNEITSDAFTTTPIEGEDGNYALKYLVTSSTYNNTHITRALETPVTFTSDKDVTIEMRVMQDGGNVYDEEGKLTTDGTGRSYFKWNFQRDSTINEREYYWGTLWYNNDGKVSFLNGYTQQGNETDGYYYSYPKDVNDGYHATLRPNINFAENTNEKWLTYKVTINGTEKTADYVLTDDNGTELGRFTDLSIDFPDSVVWGSATGSTGPVWIEDALRTLDFRMRNANTLYVDYVRVYEVKQESVQANLVNGRYVQFDENIEVKLTTEAEALTLIEETAKLTTAAGEDVAASVSYDAENKILTVNPTQDLTAGDIYNLTFTDNEFNTFTGTTEFELEARAARSYGIVVNDTFDDLQLGVTDNASGWYLSSNVDAAYKGSIEIAEEKGATGKVLKVTGKMDGGTVANNKQTYLTKKIGGGIEYKEGTEVIIRTRVKHTNNAARMVMVANRPDSSILPTNALGANLYNLFVANTNSGVDVYNGTAGGGTQGGSSKLASGVDLSNVWLDVELTIDGYNQEMDAVVKAYDEAGTTVVGTYPASDLKLVRTASVFEKHYGIGTAKAAFDALERLGFTFRNSSTDDTLYIDYIEVYEVYGDVTVSAGETYKPGEAIDVKFDVPHGDDAFKDAVSIVDAAGEIVEATKSINNAKNVVTITPDEALTEGAYKVVVDTTNIPAEVYTISNTTATLYVTDKEYLIYDEFGKDDVEGWEAKVFDGQTSTNTMAVTPEEDGSSNYVLKYTAADASNSYYGYISKAPSTPAVFNEDNNVVIEARMKQGTTGRSFIKYNLDGVSYSQNEWNYLWGNLIMNQTGNVSLFNGYKAGSTGYYTYPSGFGGTAAVGNNQNVITGATDKWYTYKIVIHGGTAGENHTATGNTADYYIYDENGDEIEDARRTGFSIDFPDGVSWGSESSNTTMSWVEDALNTLDFRLREATTLEIDYVKVWEYTSADVRVNTVEGKTFEAGKAIEFKVTAADGAVVSDAIVDTVTVSTDATVAYENGILSVTPENVAEGDTVTVTFADNDYVKYVDSTTEFTVTARGERETGVIINDTFDGTYAEGATEFDGWVAGESTVETKLAVDTEKFDGMSVLKLWTEDSNATHNSTGKQAIAYRKLGDGVEFTEGKQVIIKTKIYQEAANTASTGRFDLKFNRPNSTTQISAINDGPWMSYGILRQTNNAASVVSKINSANPTSGNPHYPNVNDISGLTTANQWVEYTITLDGVAGTMKVESGTYTANGVFDLATVIYEDLHGEGATMEDYYVKALESLTFKNPVAEPVYIDYIKVYEDSAAVDIDVRSTARYDKGFTIKLDTTADISSLGTVATVEGVETTQSVNNDNKVVTLIPEENLVLDQEYTLTLDADVLADAGLLYEGETTFTVKARDEYIINDDFNNNSLGSWRAGATKADASAYDYGVADGLMYLTVKDSDKSLDIAAAPNLINDFADVDYEDGTNIIIKAKYKHMGSGANDRAYIKFNRPDIANFSGNEHGTNWYMLTGMQGTKYVVPGKDASAPTQVYPESGDGNMAGEWVESTVEIDYANKRTYTTLVIDGKTYGPFESELENSAAELADAGAPATGFTSLNSLTFILRQANGIKTGNSIYVDYVQVYEKVRKVAQANLIDGRYFEKGQPIKVKLTSDKELTEGAIKDTVTLTNNGTANAATISYADGILNITPEGEVNAGDKFTLTLTDSDVLVYTGTKVFELEARAAREATGAKFVYDFEEDTVTDNRTASGWHMGEAKDGYEGSLAIEDGVLVISPVDSTSVVMGEYSTATVKLGGGIKLKDDNEIVIKTKFKNENSDKSRVLLQYNRPDTLKFNDKVMSALGGNLFALFAHNPGDGSNRWLGVGNGISGDDPHQGNTYSKILYNNPDDNLKGKWIEAELRISGATGKLTMTAVIDGKTYTNEGSIQQPVNVFEELYGEGTDVTAFDALDRLTFSFRNSASQKVYVDYVEVYEQTLVTESATAKFMNGEDEVAAITESGNVTPTFTIQSKDNAETDYYVIAAKYDDGRLVSTQMKKVTVAGTQTVTLDAIAVDHTDTGLVVKAFVWNTDMVPVCEATAIKPTVYTIYMSANGNDSNEGYESTPVATLNRAVELANDAKTKGYATSEVIVADGNYELTGETISIGSNLKADSLTVRGEDDGDDEKAEFINGIAFKIGDATKVNDTAILERLNHHTNYETIAANLYAIDIKNLIPEGTEIPEMNLPGTYSYYCDGYSFGDNGVFDITEPELSPNELFYKGETMTVARYPDGAYASLGTVTTDKAAYDAGGYNAYYDTQSVTRNWMEDKNTGATNSTYIAVANRTVTPFNVKLEQSANWAGADQAIAFGFWMYDWATQSTPVSFANGVMTSKYPSHYGLAEGARYYVYNLLEEISQPGEYFIDRDKDSDTHGMLYFYKPEGATEDDEITMSLYGSENVGIIDITANNVTIKDLVFTASRGKAIRIAGENITVDGCEISGTAHGAVSFGGNAKNSVIQNCKIYDVNGGISLAGGSTDTLTAGGNKALYNTITNFSRLDKTYTDAINVSGMGNTASYNTISEGEHLAIRLSGVDNEVSYNDISNVLKEADDMGAIYHGRSWTSRDNKIKFNFIHDLASTAVSGNDSAIGGIFLDDHTADFEVYGNIFYDIAGHGVRLNKGREHKINNNIFGKLEYPVNGSQASGNASDYTSQISGVRALLNYGVAAPTAAQTARKEAWVNSIYASELFNADKTDYNSDLLWSKGLEFKNNFTAASTGYTVGGTWTNDNTEFTIAGNGSLTNMPTTKAAITSSVADKSGTFDFTDFDESFLKAIGITE